MIIACFKGKYKRLKISRLKFFFHKKFKNFEDVKVLNLYCRMYVICENVIKYDFLPKNYQNIGRLVPRHGTKCVKIWQII